MITNVLPRFLMNHSVDIDLHCVSTGSEAKIQINLESTLHNSIKKFATETNYYLFMVALCNRETIYIFMLWFVYGRPME